MLRAGARTFEAPVVERHQTARVGVARLHGGADGELDRAAAIKSRRERVAHTPDGGFELPTLALDLLDLLLELLRHVVELAPKPRELVRPVDRDLGREVAGADPPRCREELLDLPLERAYDEDRRGEREDQEGEQDRADQQAPLGDRVGEVARFVEDADRHHRPDPSRQALRPATVLPPADLDVARLLLRETLLVERGRGDVVPLGQPYLQAGQPCGLAHVRARAGVGRGKHAERTSPGRTQRGERGRCRVRATRAGYEDLGLSVVLRSTPRRRPARGS